VLILNSLLLSIFFDQISVESRSIVNMVGATLFHRRKHSWPTEEFISRSTLQLVSLFLVV